VIESNTPTNTAPHEGAPDSSVRDEDPELRDPSLRVALDEWADDGGRVPHVDAGPSPESTQRTTPAALRAAGRGLAFAGAALAKGALWLGARVADGYRAVDPDLRRHVAHAPLIGLSQVTPAKTIIEALPDDGYRPVLFVHGLGGHPGNFGGARAYFRFMGRTRSYAIAFPSHERIPEMAASLKHTVDAMISLNQLDDGTKIDIVAHSQGGLVARYALSDPAFAARVHTLVTMGTPHAGTYTARFAATTKTLDLRPDSEVVTTLAAQLPWPGPPAMPQIVSLWSKSDLLLLPPESGKLVGATNVEMHDFTHLSYLLHPRAWQRAWTGLS
jgi:pimeloyl-ACP methyl ester carboxylesterase